MGCVDGSCCIHTFAARSLLTCVPHSRQDWKLIWSTWPHIRCLLIAQSATKYIWPRGAKETFQGSSDVHFESLTPRITSTTPSSNPAAQKGSVCCLLHPVQAPILLLCLFFHDLTLEFFKIAFIFQNKCPKTSDITAIDYSVAHRITIWKYKTYLMPVTALF